MPSTVRVSSRSMQLTTCGELHTTVYLPRVVFPRARTKVTGAQPPVACSRVITDPVMPAPPWLRGRQLVLVVGVVSESTSLPRFETANTTGASATTGVAPTVTPAWVGAVARMEPSAARRESVASYAPAATGAVVPWVAVQANAAVMSAPLAPALDT